MCRIYHAAVKNNSNYLLGRRVVGGTPGTKLLSQGAGFGELRCASSFSTEQQLKGHRCELISRLVSQAA